MSLRRAVTVLSTITAVATLSTLAACDRTSTEPLPLAPSAASFQRGADDAKPRQEPQPGDDRGKHVQAADDKGGKGRGRGADDPANHG